MKKETFLKLGLHRNKFKKLYRNLIKIPLWRLRDAWWWVKYRVIPKHKYTTIKLKRLKPGYYDPDTLILYTMFEIFEEFMERQLTNPQLVWEYAEEHYPEWMDPYEIEKDIAHRNQLWEEMNELYNWWVARPQRVETLPVYPTLPKEWGPCAVFNEDYADEPLVKQWQQISDIRLATEEAWNKEDIEMMIRLAKIINNLWD